MPSSDISLEVPIARIPRERSLRVAGVLRVSLLITLLAMTWALPLSATLAINLFRLSVILWFVQSWSRRRELSHSRIFVPLLCFFAITAVASLTAADRTASWQQMKVVELGFAAVMIADAIRNLRQLRFLVAGLLLTSVIAAGVAIWQVRSGEMLRAQGFFKHYINFGEMLLLVALLSFGTVIASFRGAGAKWKFLTTATFLLLTAGLAATATRTFLAVLLFGCAVMVWMCFRWKVRAIAAAALLVAILLGGVWLQARRGVSWFDSADPGTRYRFLIWKDGARIIRAHPLLGVGFANVQRHPERFDMVAYRTFPDMISHFHSIPIEIAADCGLPALAVWCWLMYACFAAARRAFSLRRESAWGRGIALGVLGAIAAFQLASLFHYILGDAEPMLIFWILVGVAIILEQQDRSLVRSWAGHTLATNAYS